MGNERSEAAEPAKIARPGVSQAQRRDMGGRTRAGTDSGALTLAALSGGFTPAILLDLQRTIGNQAVGLLLRGVRPSLQPPIQRGTESDDEETQPSTPHRKRLPSTPTATLPPVPSTTAKTLPSPIPSKPKKSLPPVPPRPKIVTIPVAPKGKGGKGQQVVALEPDIITEATRPAILDALAEWQVFALNTKKAVEARVDKETKDRFDLGNDYYATENAENRARRKELTTLAVHLGGAANEAKSIANALAKATESSDEQAGLFQRKGALGHFGVLRYDGVLQAVVEWIGEEADFIANIVNNPRNLLPADDQDTQGTGAAHTPVGGVAKAVIGLTILQHRASGKADEDITLYALNNKVKGIYDYYGFRVYMGEDASRRLLTRPARGQKEERPGGDLRAYKTAWHEKSSNMAMTPELADKFVQDNKLEQVLAVPDELKAFLAEKYPPKPTSEDDERSESSDEDEAEEKTTSDEK